MSDMQDNVKELGTMIIDKVCETGMTIDDVEITFELVLKSMIVVKIFDRIENMLGPSVTEEAEQILREAGRDVG